MEALARPEAVLAELGRRALAGIDPSVLIDEAVSLVAQCLRAEYCGVLELLPDASAFTVRAGVGWKKGVVGQPFGVLSVHTTRRCKFAKDDVAPSKTSRRWWLRRLSESERR